MTDPMTLQSLALARNEINKLRAEIVDLDEALQQGAEAHNAEVGKVVALTAQNDNLRAGIAAAQTAQHHTMSSADDVERSERNLKIELTEALETLDAAEVEINRLRHIHKLARDVLTLAS
ncbi:MAG: hypothetical protein KAI73_10985 [Rhodospirillaceae bacterium]|nr:hypothetical protein [Rhodospirillaceae bacterium]